MLSSTTFNTLTSKQKKVYNIIEAFIREKGIPPTVREIGEIIGEKTPGAVQGILNRLEKKGVIIREAGMARSIQLVNDETCYEKPVYIPQIKKISARNIENLTDMYNVEKYHPMPQFMLGGSSNCFIVSCPDNSLMSKGITYEDTLVINREPELKDGDIVLILFDNHALLRYFYKTDDPDTVKLTAPDSLIDKELFSKSEFTLIGKLVGKFTRF